ncbi:hypothetical protein F7725_003992 [Dissostichus mawsoni]|uniref:Ig-like domain-containing protein n=1 Tax=Dissostichus mawsoni TaxID=36200 RepID=A0A7J5YBT9_DISMA|nr:hypothetical protein F7725_003992 [Dissostichus mawsoni]
MAAVSELSVLLFALISNIHAEELITIRKENDSFTFKLPEEASSCLISRFVGEEKLVLWNTSDLWNQNSSVPEEDLKQRLVSMANTSSYMIQNLTHSDSGLYQEECWTEGQVTQLLWEKIDLPCRGAADNLDVQWLKQDYRYEEEIWNRVFGDNTASVMDNGRRYQVVENTSALRISNISTTNFRLFNCLVMNQQQCVSSHPAQLWLNTEIIYRSVEETVVLQCPVTDFSEEEPPYWTSDFLNSDQGQLDYTLGLYNQIRSNVCSDTDGRFVIPNVTLGDTGEYWCAVTDRYQCLSSTKTVLKHRDPFGVHSSFYAVRCSALSVLLLMLCVVVVTVTLRTRTRDT